MDPAYLPRSILADTLFFYYSLSLVLSPCHNDKPAVLRMVGAGYQRQQLLPIAGCYPRIMDR